MRDFLRNYSQEISLGLWVLILSAITAVLGMALGTAAGVLGVRPDSIGALFFIALFVALAVALGLLAFRLSEATEDFFYRL